jgi:hypothetical protein
MRLAVISLTSSDFILGGRVSTFVSTTHGTLHRIPYASEKHGTTQVFEGNEWIMNSQQKRGQLFIIN